MKKIKDFKSFIVASIFIIIGLLFLILISKIIVKIIGLLLILGSFGISPEILKILVDKFKSLSGKSPKEKNSFVANTQQKNINSPGSLNLGPGKHTVNIRQTFWGNKKS